MSSLQVEIRRRFPYDTLLDFPGFEDDVQALLHGALNASWSDAVLLVVFELAGAAILGDVEEPLHAVA